MQYSWSDISKQEVNLMMTHEPQTLQSYIGSNSMMMDVNMNLPLNVTITPKNVKSEAKIPILGRKYYFFFEYQNSFHCNY